MSKTLVKKVLVWEGARNVPSPSVYRKVQVDIWVGCPGCGVVMKGDELIGHLPECPGNERGHE